MRRLSIFWVILVSIMLIGCGSSYQADDFYVDEETDAAVQKEMREIEEVKKAAKEKVQAEIAEKKEQEAKEKAEREAKERAEKEKAEKEAMERAEKEKDEQEAKEKAEKEKDEQEAMKKAETEEASKVEADIYKIDSKTKGNADNFDKYDNPEQQDTSASWVLNNGSMKIHYPSCKDVRKIKPDNYATSNLSLQDLQSQGYNTCGHCFK